MTLHERINKRFDTDDIRLVYGITVPLLLGVVFVALFAWIGEWWLLAPTMFCLIALTLTVAIGISQMLGEDSDPESESDER